MGRIYIKFAEPNDIYKIDPLWNYHEESPNSAICPKCGNTIYVPVEVPDDATMMIPGPELYQPFPRENPYLIIPSVPHLPSIELPTGEDIYVLGISMQSIDCEECFPIEKPIESDCR